MTEFPDIKVSWWTRVWDWLTYLPWTDEQLAERVAGSVANTSYRTNWGRPITGEQTVGKPVWVGGYWTNEEAAELDGPPVPLEFDWTQPPPPPKRTKRFIYGENWNAFQRIVEDKK